jgi:enoyl-CoA hydratase/carnithine racemase
MSTVLYRRVGSIAQITLNRPEAMNSLTAEMGEQLREAWRRVEHDPEARVAVVAGAGERAFCAGVDLGELERDPDEQRELTGFGGPATGLAKPMVAAVRGYALGAGCKLAMCADVIVATPDARFGYPEARVGVLGNADFVHRPLRQLPRREAMATVLTGRLLGADRACRLGHVTEVVEPGELLAAASRWASWLAQSSPKSW